MLKRNPFPSKSGVAVALLTNVVIAIGLASAVRADVVIDEILYHPDPTNEGGEFLEILNTGSETVDLSGWVITNAVEFTFPLNTFLDAGGLLVIAEDASAAADFYGTTILGTYQRRLSDGGDTVVLQDNQLPRQVVDVVAYDDETPWPADADGGGQSIELLEGDLDNARATSWGLGQNFSPGEANRSTVESVGAVVISEIMYRPRRQELRAEFDSLNGGISAVEGDDAFGEYLELVNVDDGVVDLAGWSFTDGVGYVFPAGATLDPGSFVVIAADPDAFQRRYGLSNILGPFDGTLGDGGERVTLRDASLRVVDTVAYSDQAPWPASPDEFGVSLEVLDPLIENHAAFNWHASVSEFAPVLSEDAGGAQPEPGEDIPFDGWQLVNVTGTARSSVIDVYLGDAGEWLIDELVVLADGGGANLMPDGSFDTGDAGWRKVGNHATSGWTDGDAWRGAGSERIVATGPGSSSTNSLRSSAIPGVMLGRKYTLSFWARSIAGARSMTVAFGNAGLGASVIAETDTQLRDAWSESQNPNTDWSLRDGNRLVMIERTDTWLADLLGAGQSAWTANGVDSDAGWCRSVGNVTGVDFPTGDVGALGPVELWWAADASGSVRVSGGLYLAQLGVGDQDWVIRKNGRVLTRGPLIASDARFDSGTPQSVAQGSGGEDALTFPVEEGDTVELFVGPSQDNEAALVGVRVRVEYSRVVPPRQEADPPLGGVLGAGTPGMPNSAPWVGIPPYVREVSHLPTHPTAQDDVLITARVTPIDMDAVQRVEVEISIGTDPGTEALSMFDDGEHEDGAAGDGVYAVRVPAQDSQSLVHYRVRAVDVAGRVRVVPPINDPSPTRAYFHYDGEIDTSLTLYHLFISEENLAQLRADIRANDYVDCSLVVNGTAYPHIEARFRGRGSRVHPKNQWKFRFNKSQLLDGNRTIDTMVNLPFTQKICFEVFDRAAIENLESDVVRLHMDGAFWGLYLVFESPNRTWVRKHGYPGDTEVYKARTVGTSTFDTNLCRGLLRTDDHYWGAWNKKIRPFERPTHIRDFVENVSDLSDAALLPWLATNVDVGQWFSRWTLYVLLNIDDFGAHNYYVFRPGGGRWKQLAYDLDTGLSFARFGPLPQFFGNSNKIFQRTLQSRTLKRLYYLTKRRAMETFFREEELFPIVDALYAATVADRAAENARWRGSTIRPDTTEFKTVMQSQRAVFLRINDAIRLPDADKVPAIDPPGGGFEKSVLVTLSAPKNWHPVYTVDGTDPRLSGTRVVYSGPFEIVESSVVRAASLFSDDPSLDLSSGDWTDLSRALFTIEPESEESRMFVRGDCNGDRVATADVTDAIAILLYQFLGVSPPCLAACDVDGDGEVRGEQDALYLLRYNFLGDSPPPAPFPQCGPASTGDGPLECATATCPG